MRKELEELTVKLDSEKADKTKSEITLREYQKSYEQLRAKEQIAFLLTRVATSAHDQLLSNPQFADNFLKGGDCKAFVLSVDIRRSTELMLKARTPAMFAAFISRLCEALEQVIKDSLGVFDKFTGDGVLAFFPDFYSGDDAGLLTLSAAQQCQEVFRKLYREHRSSFSSVLADVGLGIGIDFGSVNLLRVAGGLTVVGSPVVYACRLSSAPAGHIYLNQPAFEVVSSSHGNYCYTDEVILEIKHEGNILCYDVQLSPKEIIPKPAPWQVETEAPHQMSPETEVASGEKMNRS